MVEIRQGGVSSIWRFLFSPLSPPQYLEPLLPLVALAVPSTSSVHGRVETLSQEASKQLIVPIFHGASWQSQPRGVTM